jgi:hypothetical protein
MASSELSGLSRAYRHAMCYLILSLIQSGHLGHAGSNEDNQRIRDKKTGKDNPAVFGMLVVESKGRMSTIFGNVTLTSKSSYRGSQYDMLSDLRKSNADFMFVSLGCMRFSFLFFFFPSKDVFDFIVSFLSQWENQTRIGL